MGIKDLFGKGKKAEFREKAKEAVAKGKLAPGKAEELAALSKEHDIEDPGDDKTMLRREIYNKAAGGAKARGKLTEAEAAELAKIQKFLALRASRSAAVKYAPQANFFLYAEGIRLERTVGHTLLRFKSGSDDTAEITGELLSALMR